MFSFLVTMFSLLLLVELAIWFTKKLPLRVFAAGTAIELGLLAVWLVLTGFNPYAPLLLIVAAYRVFNLCRLVAGRRQADHMYQATRRASFWLVAAQLLSLILYIANPAISGNVLILLAGLMLVGSILFAGATQRNLMTTRPVKDLQQIADADLPTVSVLVPARNETEDLNECLKSLVRSNYPKLEIIVLDDCSQNKRTPEIIKGFAQDGVRFIAGTAAPESWLAKNYAYHKLVEASSGDYLLFCGVDTRFKPQAIEEMVLSMLEKKKTMISFIPSNIIPPTFSFSSLLVQPSRYAWELALPRRSLQRPPTLSTAWMITKTMLESAGGFAGASRTIAPERILARYAATHEDSYSFVQSDTKTGVMSAKSFSEQRATAVRTRYPQLHQSLELTALTSLIELIVLVGPFVLYGWALINQQWLIFAIVDVAAIFLIIMYAQIVNLTYRRFLLRSLWMLPFVAVYDVVLLNYSMFKYEFSDVQWKGRNVCIPVMQVIDRLPKV